MLLETMIAIMEGWKKVFSQSRTAYRAMKQAIGSICVVGRRTIARSYLVQGAVGDWSSEYKLYRRPSTSISNMDCDFCTLRFSSRCINATESARAPCRSGLKK